MTPLQTAALAVIDKWVHSHPLKELAVLELRKALDAELQQSVKPVCWFNPSAYWMDAFADPKDYPNGVEEWSIPLYLHPPQQVAVTSGERAELIADCRNYAEQGMSGTAIKLARRAADMLEADDAFRPDWVNYRQGVKDGKAEAATQESLTAQAQEGNMPDCWVVVKNGQILGTHDEPAHIDGLQAVRYVPAQQAKPTYWSAA